MKFIHAVIYDIIEYKELCEYGRDFESWGDITDGDYIVHCLYDVDNERIIIHEDNTHASVETMIESFLDGIRFAGGEVEVTKAYLVVNDGCSYDSITVKEKLIAGNYGEVL